MDTASLLKTIPQLTAVQTDLEVVSTMGLYVTEKTALKTAMLEVRTMNGWSIDTVKASCKKVMEVLGAVFEEIMSDFNEATEAEIDSISLEPFETRFQEEIEEQDKLKAAAKLVMDMASRVAVALNITVPAAKQAVVGEPKLTFVKSILSLVVEDAPRTKKNPKAVKVAVPSAWLREPVLLEEDDSVQKLALMDSKLSAGGVDAIRAFAKKFNKTDADLAVFILDALDDARKQMAQSEEISTLVTLDFQAKRAIVLAILEAREAVNATHSYISGK